MVQIADSHDGDTYRVAHTTGFPGAIYVLHAFTKKSVSGIRTPRRHIDLIKDRLERARADNQSRRDP